MPGKPKKKTTARQASLKTIIAKIDQLRSDMKTGFMQINEQLRAEMPTGTEKLRGEMQSQIGQLRAEMQTGFAQVNTRISSLEMNLAALDAFARENLDAGATRVSEAGNQADGRIDQRAKEWHDRLTEVQTQARRTS